MNIPRTMATQHPDNVSVPWFAESPLLGGEDEVQEAYYGFSHLGCQEQMWDFEGKEVDSFVVKKLLTKNERFFREKKLGRDVRLTFRVPNPEVERGEAKILLETLEAIPRSYDAAKLFYGEDIAPMFEVILPMTGSARALNRIYRYYRDVVVGKGARRLAENDITIGEWIGEFKPEFINVIPLFEDKDQMLRAADIVREYLRDKNPPYQRVFLARSDPAVNYGQIGAVLLNKIALWRLHKLSEEIRVPLYPILGVGSAPFRGNLRPETVGGILHGYPSVETFTIQSSFRFDHPPEAARAAIARLNDAPRGEPIEVDAERTIGIIDKYAAAYSAQVMALAPVINRVARHVPPRRKRKLHVGLFGYSRQIHGVRLPRAIAFTAAMYSLGVPPELLGFDAITPEDFQYITKVYPTVVYDLHSALQFANLDSTFFPAELKSSLHVLFDPGQTHREHRELTDYIARAVAEGAHADLSAEVLRAAHLRGFLG